MRVELTDERRSALRIAIDALRDTIAGFEPTKQQQIAATVLRAMLEAPDANDTSTRACGGCSTGSTSSRGA